MKWGRGSSMQVVLYGLSNEFLLLYYVWWHADDWKGGGHTRHWTERNSLGHML